MLRKAIILSALGLTSFAFAGQALAACKSADRQLSGRYQLQGVREVGSLIQLLPDGRFGYMMTYGAYDEVARGCWQKRAGTVVLTPTQMRTGPGGKKFQNLTLRISRPGVLLRQLGPRQMGRYVRRGR
jgi:hypothetical protein